MDTLIRDLRYALRTLWRSRGFTAVALLTLAVGIGATSAIFTVVDAALLRPLPFEDPSRLVHLWEAKTGGVGARSEASYPDFVDWRARNHVFTGLAGYQRTSVVLQRPDGPAQLRGVRVTANFLSLLGVRPSAGRDFREGEDQVGQDRVALLTDALWHSAYGGDPSVVGRVVTTNGLPYTLVGVLPASFQFGPAADAQIVIPASTDQPWQLQRGVHWINVVGRLKPGVAPDRARADMNAVMRNLAAEYPATNSGRSIELLSLRDATVGNVRPILLVLLGTVGFVLLIACANVASLLLTRAAARRREMAVRAALGAGARRLLRQLLTETVVLSGLGALLGAGLAYVGVRLLVRGLPAAQLRTLPFLTSLSLDGRALAFTAAIALITGVLFGLVPAAQIAGAALGDSLKEGTRGSSGAGRRARDGLVVAELALTVVLLIGAGLLTRSLVQLSRVDPGFSPERVTTFALDLPSASYPDGVRQAAFYGALLERIRALPGVRSVAASSKLPLEAGNTGSFRVEGEPEPPAGDWPEANVRSVSSGYFSALGVPLLAGRDLSERDDSSSPPVIVVNRTLASHLFPHGAVGQHLLFGRGESPARFEIVGVAADVKGASLDEVTDNAVFFSYRQLPDNNMAFAVRSPLDPAGLVTAVRGEVHALDPTLPVFGVQSFEEKIASSPSVFLRRYPMFLIGAFAAIALLLAIIGTYGVISYTVVQRSREMGIRIALGARPADITGLVLRHGAALAAAGLAIGLVAAFGLARLLASLLYGVTPSDPLTYLGAAAVLGCVAMLASYLPARRATRVDPLVVLRSE